jgi:hypothetical protein
MNKFQTLRDSFTEKTPSFPKVIFLWMIFAGVGGEGGGEMLMELLKRETIDMEGEV